MFFFQKDLKKKKKNKKKAFDLEAFERELAEVEGLAPTSGRSSVALGDEEGEEGEDAPEDGLFAAGEDAAMTEGLKTKTQIAAEKKAWLKEPDRDYTYDEVSLCHLLRFPSET